MQRMGSPQSSGSAFAPEKCFFAAIWSTFIILWWLMSHHKMLCLTFDAVNQKSLKNIFFWFCFHFVPIFPHSPGTLREFEQRLNICSSRLILSLTLGPKMHLLASKKPTDQQIIWPIRIKLYFIRQIRVQKCIIWPIRCKELQTLNPASAVFSCMVCFVKNLFWFIRLLKYNFLCKKK